MTERDQKKENNLLSAMAKALANAVTSIDIDSCIQIRGKKETGELDYSIEKAVTSFKEIIAGIKSNPALQTFSKRLSENGYSPYLLQEIMIAIVTTGFNADIPSQYYENKIIKAAIEENLMTIDRALLGLATLLESSQQEPAESIRKEIVEHKEELRYFQTRFMKHANEMGASEKRLDHFNTIFDQVLWRTTKQSPGALIQRCVEVIDRIANKCGITKEMRRELCLSFSKISDFNEGDIIMRDALECCIGERLLHLNSEQNHGKVDETYSNMTIGRMLLKIGGVSLIVGFAGIQSLGIFIITGGVLALFLGMIFLIIGSFEKNNTKNS